jgi:hypothetical protein
MTRSTRTSHAFARQAPSMLAAAALACASGPPLLLGQPITKEVSVFVHVSKEAAHTDELGGIAGLVEKVTDGLSQRGVKHQLFAADDEHPHAPMIEIWVLKWDQGDRESRAEAGAAFGLIGQGLTAGGYEVVSRVYRDGDTKPSCEYRYKGSIFGNDEAASSSQGESVGSSILSDALRDSATCTPKAPSNGPKHQ